MAKIRLFPPGFRVTAADGTLITDGATVTVYLATTTTPSSSWTDSGGGTALSNPHSIPSTGIADMWVTYGTAYRIIIKNAAGTTLQDIDNIVGIPDSTNVGILSSMAVTVDDATSNSISRPATITHTTSGTPANGIGVGILFESESADESPCQVGSIDFNLEDVTSGSEDSYFTVFTRTAGAALKKAYQFLITGVGDYLFTGAPTATRTITLPDADLNLTLLGAGTAWTPGFTGFSANPTMTATYNKIGRRVFIDVTTTGAGTSNATGFTITGLPFTAARTEYFSGFTGTDNAAVITSASISIATTTITCYKTALTAASWTGSSTKGIDLHFSYEATA